MKKAKRWLAVLAGLLALAALSGCGQQRGGTLRVGVKDDVTNFSLYDEESGRYSGMEIDLANLLGEDMGYGAVKFVTVTTANREQMLDEGTVDMVIATASITAGRRANYDFSVSYYDDSAAVMVEASSLINSLDGLRGCRIGVMRGSSHALALAQHMAESGLIPAFDAGSFDARTFADGVSFTEFESYADIAQALEEGDVDAFVADRSILSGYTSDGRVLLDDTFAPQQYGVCTRKDSVLSSRVDAALRARIEDGTLAGLILKWGI